ncbi:MAG: DHH family phosphoesterase [Oscillospiraceae bacterium]|nr:DHH family phosphoesterase [Oscillospiraceae bacterium]
MKTIVSCLLAIAVLLSTVTLYYFNQVAGIVQAVAVLVLGMVLFVVYKIRVNKLKNTLEIVKKFVDEKDITEKYPMPAAVTDKVGDIVWCNELFLSTFLRENSVKTGNISEILGGVTPIALAKSADGYDTEYEDRKFTVYSETVDEEKGLVISFFIDDTYLKDTAEEYYETRPVVMQLKLDNLDEVYKNYRNSECEVISGELERILEIWASDYPCIFRRVSSGKFLVIMEEKGLKKICENKFDILKKIRNYKYGENPVEITLSIGVGRGKTMTECDENSKTALEMSQSRGGDQATVNTDGTLEFFGGTVSGPAKRTKIKARVIAQAYADHVAQSDSVFAMGHCFSDLDSVGAAVGVYEIATALGKQAYIVVDKDKSMAKTLIELLDEKIIPGAFINEETALKKMTDNSLLTIVDTHRAESLESKELYEKSKKTVVIDHHRRTVDYITNSVLYYDEPTASSACEMVTELIQYVPVKVELKALEAEALLSGIMLDTRNFVLSTGARTFEAAAFLKEIGADTVSVKQLFSNNFDNYKQKNAIVSTAVTYKGCAVAVATEHSKDIRIIASQVANELLNVSGVKSSYVLFEEDGKINISARSLGEMNVQVIMESLGGGGHLTMAATQLYDITLGDAVVKLEDAINKYLESQA